MFDRMCFADYRRYLPTDHPLRRNAHTKENRQFTKTDADYFQWSAVAMDMSANDANFDPSSNCFEFKGRVRSVASKPVTTYRTYVSSL